MISRDEFFNILKSLFHPRLIVSPEEAAYALINQNEIALEEMKGKIKMQEDKLFTWLGKFDAQKDDAGRQAIINTVSLDVEIDPNMTAIANPNNDKVY